jgi:hypothetical protein
MSAVLVRASHRPARSERANGKERAMNRTLNSDASSERGGTKEGVANEAKRSASSLAERAREEATNLLDTRKDKAVEGIETVADAIRGTSERLKDLGPLGDLAERAADRVERIASFFEGKQLADLGRDVSRFARREPALFVGATFALGLLAGRFLKSSPRTGGSEAGSQVTDTREGGDYERYDAAYGSSYYRDDEDDAFLSDEDLEEDLESYRAATHRSYGSPRPTRSTPPPPTPAPSEVARSAASDRGGKPGPA